MTVIEVIATISVVIGVLSFAGLFIARISKLETRADVCDEKHREHDKKFCKQDEINLKVDEHHIEVMKTLAIISTEIKMLIK